MIVAVRREVDPDQAEWVRQIFRWSADGWPPRRIAAELNRRRVPGPRSGAWAGSTIYGHLERGTGILNNELYIGRYVWNRSRWEKNPDTGRPQRIPRPEHEWVVVEMPELRIVPQDLWDRVKARQREQHQQSENTRKALHAKARTGAGPKFLLSGLLKCGCCGSNYAIRDERRYACSANINRGDAACPNTLRVARQLVEERVLQGIKHDLFTPEALELFKREAARLLAEHKARQRPGLDRFRKRLTEVEREIANIMAAIKAGILTPTTKAELEGAEAEKAALEREMQLNLLSFEGIADLLPRAVERYRALVDNLESVSQRDVPRARTQIKHLVGGEIRLMPEDGYLVAELSGSYPGLVRLANETAPRASLVWLGDLDSNQDCSVQSREFYR